MSEVPTRRGRRTKTPWARKRRRVLAWLCMPLLLLLPWGIWRAGVAGDVRAQLAALEATGQPVTLAQLNAQNVTPDASRNAAPLYQEALTLYHDVPPAQWDHLPFLGIVDLVPGSALSPEAREATAAWIALNAGTLEKLEAARHVAFCSYLVPYKPSGYNNIQVLRQLEPMAKLACAAAAYHADRDEPEAAGAALNQALALARSMGATGLFTILASQWEIEVEVLKALQYAMSRCTLPESTLDEFAAYFSPARRREQIAHVVSVERCLFLARVREGYRRGMGRNILIASGAGDLNARVHVGLMGHIAAWVDAPLAEQREIESRFDIEWDAVNEAAYLYMTLHVSSPPGYWHYYRKALDEAALARVGIALYRHHATQGRFPDSLEALAPEITEMDLILQTTGTPMHYENLGDQATLHNGGLATNRRGITSGPPNDGTPIDPNTLERIEFVVAYASESD